MDTEPGIVASILPGGDKHDLYKNWLDKIAVFKNGLKGSRGEFVPVIFQPFYELGTGPGGVVKIVHRMNKKNFGYSLYRI